MKNKNFGEKKNNNNFDNKSVLFSDGIATPALLFIT